MKFRVCCLHPNEFEGTRQLEATRICGHGHGLTIKEMNKNLLKKGSPYIRIDYCKYCYKENTLGVLDETSNSLRKLGFIINYPHETESGLYEIEELHIKQ
jgi:hypothetical protein